MPLSEEELRLLEQMERALVEDDPKLASTLRGTTQHQVTRRRVVLGGLVLVVGIALLVVLEVEKCMLRRLDCFAELRTNAARTASPRRPAA